MREILFRGKQIKDGKWIEGYYCPKPYSHFPCEPTVFPFETINKDWHGERVIPETVGQYTGLKDKNGRKIFEGDIVKMRAYGVGYHCTSVYFRDGKFAVDGTQYHFKDICSNSVEVIGNIYDNPELLKGGGGNG